MLAQKVKEVLFFVFDADVVAAVENFGDANRFIASGGSVQETDDQRGIEDKVSDDEIGAVVVALPGNCG